MALILIISPILNSCQKEELKPAEVEKISWGKTGDGNNVDLYTLKNNKGSVMQVTNYGAIIVSLTMPDRNNKFEDIVLGNDSLYKYLRESPYFGAIVGRYGNRIGNGKFKIDDVPYQLTINNGENHLHGGLNGFDKVVWQAEPVKVENGSALKLSYHSYDGEEGYPGNLDITVFYTLSNENELIIEYSGKTDKKTIFNPTHHSYFNLTGKESSILDHELIINADQFTPVDSGLITTGELVNVENTAFDFRTAKAIGKDITNDEEQLKFGLGYDHNWVLNNYDGTLKLAVTLYEKNSGRVMEVLTTEPGLQFYSGNFLDGSITGKNNVVYNYRSGLCLEAQHYPDSPNKENFPSVILKPGDTYSQKTVYRFSAK
ncbi:MAG: galactose mutarotase [Melioribacteraceae bacterium]|nr:galactose mutarotase [Melioribacteraceae bacterium]